MKAFGLFSGIGGFEDSLMRHGIECVGLCEIDPVAQAVLRDRFPGVPVYGDVSELVSIRGADILTAGFPCQDLSQAGEKTGISGTRSRLVDEVFRLIANAKKKPRWVILENVSYMLRLNRGNAMAHIVRQAEKLGYSWAYRTLDARAFGLPQRRERVIIVLSRSDEMAGLFPDPYRQPPIDDSVGQVDPDRLYGFYWTEGKRGLGWARDSVPTIKGGSSLGIPSPPAIWSPRTGMFGTPSIRDAERMFGFEPDWTQAADSVSRRAGARWKLVGNTICVPMVDWVVQQLLNPMGVRSSVTELDRSDRFPGAAYGQKRRRFAVQASTWPTHSQAPQLSKFLMDDLKPLSARAASGFFGRAQESTTIRFADGFLHSLATYIDSLSNECLASR